MSKYRVPRVSRRPRQCIQWIAGLNIIVGIASPVIRADENETPAGADLRELIDHARDQVFPALVNIQLVTSQFSGGKEYRRRVVGSGTIISIEGHVLTNQHVTGEGRRFRCTLADKQEITAELVGEDPLTDLAVLKLNLGELADPKSPIPVAKLGDSSKLGVGEQVLAMGSPFALSRSVTLGVVSNTERVFAGGLGSEDGDDMRLDRGQRTGLFTRWIQHDALIHPGNSGGPLVSLAGEVVGVNELGGSAMGFAIPANLARQVADALIAEGEVKRSWMGVSFKPIEKTGLKAGILVNSVVEDSPAFVAGLRAGDVITGLNGEAVTVRFVEEVPLLMKRVADQPIGSSIEVIYQRDGKDHKVSVITAKLERDRGDEREFRAWGLTAMAITPFAAREHLLDSTKGVLVTGVRQGGGASTAKPPLAEDDVIKKVEDQAIDDLDGFIATYERIMAAEPQPEYLLIEFERMGKAQLTLLEPKPDEDPDPTPEVDKAWVGVAVQPVLSDLAERLGGKEMTGFRVTQVYPDTKAALSDLKVGDIITHLNGKRIEPPRAEDAGRFHREVKRLDIDGQAELTVVRDAKPLALTVPLERTRMHPEELPRDHNRDFEIIVREVSFFDRVDNRWDLDTKGVMVMSVEPAGWVGLGGVWPGDLIQRIDEHAVTDLKSFRAAIKKVTEARPERVVFYVLRGVSTRFQYIEPEWSPAGAKENSQ